VREAIGTAAWAYQVGDSAFEARGIRMINDVLRQLETEPSILGLSQKSVAIAQVPASNDETAG